MRKILFLFVGLIYPFFGLKAFHIVGGEIEFITEAPGVYRLNLIQYRDEAQNQNTTYDQTATLYLFSNRDDGFVLATTLELQTVENVRYTNIECERDELQTSRVLYSTTLELEPSRYDDEEGYYWVWERCCRNQAVDNIINPGGTGMKYVLEIPPLWKDGAPFINSSPVLNRPLSDYACIDQFYYVDFVGVDLDGDSLVYKMVNPLSTQSIDAVPVPTSKPHIEVRWAPGFSLDNVVNGSRPLGISNQGLLTVTPLFTGLYVFSVLVEEWRDGTKIGEVQRDFQMLVVDECEPPDPPIVGVQIPGNDAFNYRLDTLRYEVIDEKCFEFVATNVVPGETISFRADPVNFDDEYDDIFEFNTRFVSDQDSIIVEVCVPDCPPIRGRPFIVDLIASDNACPLPQMDTARLIIQVTPPPNADPSLSPIDPSHVVNENELYSIPLTGLDSDPDDLDFTLSLLGLDDDPANYGFSLNITRDDPGTIQGELLWDTSCGTADFSSLRTFNLQIGVDDDDICEEENADVESISMSVILPPNTFPNLSTTAPGSIISSPLDQLITFEVQVEDPDLDPVTLVMEGVGFDPTALGVRFEPTAGLGSAIGDFIWPVDCDSVNVLERDSFTFRFISEDSDVCQELNSDTLEITIEVSIPDNTNPTFEEYPDYVLEVNQLFQVEIEAQDTDPSDSLTLKLFDNFRRPNTNTLRFPQVKGQGTVSSILSWTPECDLLDLGESSRVFELVFQAFDDRCPIQASTTKSIFFEVRETREFYDRFEPPNAFSPNGDGVNDFYSMSDLPQPEQNLPPDNCDDWFQYISIHDRSGTKVFKSDKRDFVWAADNVAAGTYYYVVKYSQTEYRGYIQLLK